ncbi:MAG: tRNA (guanosine(37)-N1)-methyltransferase TrmD, partial [Bdellovibrionota bacterium]
MLSFSVVTLFPQMIVSHFSEGIIGQALKKGLFNLETKNPRDHALGVHKTVDDRPFGGGDGMVMLAETLSATIEEIKKSNPDTHVIYLTPHGKPWSAVEAKLLSEKKHVTLISGRYGGIDQRFINKYVDQEFSIGDYVLSGGEIAALVVIDSTARFIEGALGNNSSAASDSFSLNGLEAPLFTRPEVWDDVGIPEILKSGHHQNISLWKNQMGELITLIKRPDLAA